jgi:hypothetical protein
MPDVTIGVDPIASLLGLASLLLMLLEQCRNKSLGPHSKGALINNVHIIGTAWSDACRQVSYALERRPAGGRCTAVLGRRTRTARAPASQRLPVARPHRPVDALP